MDISNPVGAVTLRVVPLIFLYSLLSKHATFPTQGEDSRPSRRYRSSASRHVLRNPDLVGEIARHETLNDEDRCKGRICTLESVENLHRSHDLDIPNAEFRFKFVISLPSTNVIPSLSYWEVTHFMEGVGREAVDDIFKHRCKYHVPKKQGMWSTSFTVLLDRFDRGLIQGIVELIRKFYTTYQEKLAEQTTTRKVMKHIPDLDRTWCGVRVPAFQICDHSVDDEGRRRLDERTRSLSDAFTI